MPSNKSEGNPVLHDISIGSIALTVKAVSANKLPKSPGLDVRTFVPVSIANLFRKNSILLIFLGFSNELPFQVPANLGNGLVVSSPTCLSIQLNLSTVKVATLVSLF